jgi:CubicO group peptidase (beta-lactamase class C family)
VLYSGGAGKIGFGQDASSWDADSFTWIASMTKIITSTAVMQLVEKGLITLDQDVRELVPELGKMQVLKGFDSNHQPILESPNRPITLR